MTEAYSLPINKFYSEWIMNLISKFYFVINTKKLDKVWKIKKLLNLNINLIIIKQTYWLKVKTKVEVEIQTDMNSIKNGWDSIKQAENPFSLWSLSQTENERNR